MLAVGSTSAPPVGRSGPRMWRISSSTVGRAAVGARPAIQARAASSSPALCGGMLVAMPTAMPAAPLASRFGKAAGRTTGSLSLPS